MEAYERAERIRMLLDWAPALFGLACFIIALGALMLLRRARDE